MCPSKQAWKHVVPGLVLLLTSVTGMVQAQAPAPAVVPQPAAATPGAPAAPTATYAPAAGWPAPVGGHCGMVQSPCCGCESTTSLRVIPLGWIPSMKGDVTIRGETAPVDVSIGDLVDYIFNDLDFALMGQLEGRSGKWGFIFFGAYMAFDFDNQIRRFDFTSTYKQSMYELTGTYEVDCLQGMLPCGSRVEALAGLRRYELSASVALTGPRGRTVSVDGSENWLDPFFGARVRVPVNECATIQVRGDLGGFEIWERSSKFVWNLEAIFEYRTSERCSLYAGWRWLDVDYANGPFAYDMRLSGPVLGFAIDF